MLFVKILGYAVAFVMVAGLVFWLVIDERVINRVMQSARIQFTLYGGIALICLFAVAKCVYRLTYDASSGNIMKLCGALLIAVVMGLVVRYLIKDPYNPINEAKTDQSQS